MHPTCRLLSIPCCSANRINTTLGIDCVPLVDSIKPVDRECCSWYRLLPTCRLLSSPYSSSNRFNPTCSSTVSKVRCKVCYKYDERWRYQYRPMDAVESMLQVWYDERFRSMGYILSLTGTGVPGMMQKRFQFSHCSNRYLGSGPGK
jgi:hypothetical protein